jgi:hypothetical protein
MKKIIKLNESDLINIVKRVINESTSKGLPILPDGRLYSINDFIVKRSGFPVKGLSTLLKNGTVNILRYGEGGGKIDDAIKNMDMDKIKEILGTTDNQGSNRTIIYPVTKEGSPAIVPPAKYVVKGSVLELIPITKADASVIALQSDVDYNQTLDSTGKPYLINSKKHWG